MSLHKRSRQARSPPTRKKTGCDTCAPTTTRRDHKVVAGFPACHFSLADLEWSAKCLRSRLGRYCEFRRLEAAMLVGTVAERFRLGVPATAQRDIFLAHRERNFVSLVIHDLDLRRQY